jgi:calcineurin-like phosphoesterase family protein
VFVIADLHLGDERVAKGRQFASASAMWAEIEGRWNAAVCPGDQVYVLGDVATGDQLHTIAALHGEKHLVAGNADDLRAILLRRTFKSVSIARWLSGVLLTHIPVHPSQLRAGTINVHGHLHRASIPDAMYRCVSADQTGFAPVLLRTLMGDR